MPIQYYYPKIFIKSQRQNICDSNFYESDVISNFYDLESLRWEDYNNKTSLVQTFIFPYFSSHNFHFFPGKKQFAITMEELKQELGRRNEKPMSHHALLDTVSNGGKSQVGEQ